MTRSYLAFDLEIVKPLPAGIGDWKAARPLGISCAGTLSSAGELNLWHGRTQEGDIADQMTPGEVGELVDYLHDAVEAGFTIVTWNGLGFDFDIVAEESGRLSDCSSLAVDHVDMMFNLFCVKGYALALDTAAKGMGLSGKTPGMSGELVPIYWAEGKRQEVLQYLTQDVRTTLGLAQEAEAAGSLSWSARSGRPQTLPLRQGWLSVRDAMALPLPDTSWMKNPWPREKFTGWLVE
jgi:hypothetical protein